VVALTQRQKDAKTATQRQTGTAPAKEANFCRPSATPLRSTKSERIAPSIAKRYVRFSPR